MKITHHRDGSFTIKVESWEAYTVGDAFRDHCWSLERASHTDLPEWDKETNARCNADLQKSADAVRELALMFGSYGTPASLPVGKSTDWEKPR